MGKRNNREKLALPPFVPLEWKILNSKAFRSLSYASRAMLPYFIGKTKQHIRSDSYLKTEFSISYKEAVSYGYARKTYARVIEDLMRKGFIDPVDKGGLKGFGLSCNVFRMSDRWKTFDEKDFIHVEWKQFNAKAQKGTCVSVKSEPVGVAV